MNISIFETLNRMSNTIIEILKYEILYSAILFIIVLGLAYLLRNKSAYWQVGLWSLVLIRLFLPPDLSFPYSARNFVEKYLKADTPPPVVEPAITQLYDDPFAPPESTDDMEITPVIPSIPPVPVKKSFEVTVSMVLTMFWLMGVLFFAVLYHKKLNHFRNIVKRADEIEDETIKNILFKWKNRFKINRHVQMFTSCMYLSPFTMGIFRPKIFIPQRLIDLPETDTLEAVIAHEMAHIKRFDDFWIKFQNLAQILYFFNPVVWYTNSRINLARESLCDQMVISKSEMAAPTYCHGILNVLKLNLFGVDIIEPISCFANQKKNLEYRIKKIMKGHIMKKHTVFVVLVVTALISVMALPMAVSKPEIDDSPDLLSSEAQAAVVAGIYGAGENSVLDQTINPEPTPASEPIEKRVVEKIQTEPPAEENILLADSSHLKKDPDEIGRMLSAKGDSSMIVWEQKVDANAENWVEGKKLINMTTYVGEDEGGVWQEMEVMIENGDLFDHQELEKTLQVQIQAAKDQLHRTLVAQNLGDEVLIEIQEGIAQLENLEIEQDGAQYIIKGVHGDKNVVFVNDPGKYSPLLKASLKGDLEEVKKLVEEGADVNETNHHNSTPLTLAAEFGHQDVAEYLIQKKANINAKDNDGDSPLILALSRNHVELAEMLIKKGANVNDANHHQSTPLTLAAQFGHTEVAKTLINKGVDVNAKDKDGDSSIILAAQEGHNEIVEMLIEKNVNVNDANHHQSTSLTLAAQFGHTEAAKMLIDKGADIHAKDKDGDSPIILASWWGHRQIVEMLIKKGANVNDTNYHQSTPLTLAAQFGHTEIVEMLIKKGAKIDAQDNDGDSALLVALMGNHRDIVDLLLKKGANVQVINDDGWTTLMRAAQIGDLKLVKTFADKGVGLHHRKDSGSSAFLIAAYYGHKEVVEYLLKNGADVNETQDLGRTALMYTALKGHSDLARTLIKHGANVNRQDDHHSTALTLAAEKGYIEIVKILVEHKANLNYKDDDGDSALKLAKMKGHTRIVRVLEDAGAKE